ncbi:MAG TPA: ABC transporter permease subunit [Bryobacteraceae bacterium]|nr:ABC transporter permease subunit [Bryobacteraceae bacterium]
MHLLGKYGARVVALVLVAGLASAALARLAPGAAADERELDPRLSAETVAAMRANEEASHNLGRFLLHYARGLAHFQLGFSQSQNAPVRELIAERGVTTIRELGIALAAALAIGAAFAIPAARFRAARVYDASCAILAGVFLSVPAALLAYVCLVLGGSATLVLALVLTPRVFLFSRNLLAQAYGATHVQMAMARGVDEFRILLFYVLAPAAGAMLAMAAATATIGVGASIPIEAICDTAGLGRLAWQAAMARDLPLLVNLTMIVALATTLAMALAEFFAPREAIA